MHRIIRTKAYEAEHGPHFNEEHARKAVNKMENEDGTRGQHWSLEETTALANQYGDVMVALQAMVTMVTVMDVAVDAKKGGNYVF